jgi:drug/metabolite transporter (DMT)-like permease
MIERKPLDTAAVGLMLLLTFVWGVQQITIKWALHGVTPVAQAAIRSVIAALLLLAWARARRIPLFDRDGTLVAGIGAGLLFAAEFCMIYLGLRYTAASRMVVFLYLAPILIALGLAWRVQSERLIGLQWAGVLLAFGGLALAFLDGFAIGKSSLFGDLCGVAAAFFWAATTVLIRASKLAVVRAEKTLFYQLAVSAVTLPCAAMALGEAGVVQVDAVVVACLAFQILAVAFASYLTWFWLLTRYLAARLSVFSFLAPLFGVVAGVVLLGETLSPRFVLAAVAVGAGIALVNLRR